MHYTDRGIARRSRRRFRPGGARRQPGEINGMQMYYEVSGGGDPMIVLHRSYMNIPGMGEIVGRRYLSQ